MNEPPQKSDPTPAARRRMPLWLRIVLMVLLALAAAAAFYINNLKIIEHLENR